MDSRVDALLAKLSHPLPAVRRRSLENLAFKVSSGLIPAARVVSDVAATRALVRFLEDPAAPEVQDVLRIVNSSPQRTRGARPCLSMPVLSTSCRR
jgi:hypothetical protein